MSKILRSGYITRSATLNEHMKPNIPTSSWTIRVSTEFRDTVEHWDRTRHRSAYKKEKNFTRRLFRYPLELETTPNICKCSRLLWKAYNPTTHTSKKGCNMVSLPLHSCKFRAWSTYKRHNEAPEFETFLLKTSHHNGNIQLTIEPTIDHQRRRSSSNSE
ncbi:Uncharacterized protein APZ42_011450 [Daphnia magna]|uniref:Uncharacterized protein n=1 Tax=Daphnia magna TaxID=35525 RepID=A0A162SP40_9CRUS|nr:Uncharacterized protein APZ42_011450 [Daphnia magna]